MNVHRGITHLFTGSRPQRLLLASLLVPFPLSALAETVTLQAPAVELDTLTVEGNRLYDMPPSEQTGGYTTESATVGTKTPAALRDIPQSTTSYTNEYIRDRQFVHLDDLAKYTAGLRVLTNDSGRSSIYARGYEYDEFNIDGLPAPMASIFGTVPSLVAFDRVEVMRGPSGLFNSTSELGGVVNMVRKRPTAEFQGHVEARYGTWDQNYQEVDVSGPLDEAGRVRGRFIASRSDTNGEVDYNANTSNTYYGALDVDLNDSTQVSFGLLHEVKNITPNNGYPTDAKGNLLDFSQSKFFGADWNYFDGKTTDLTAELTHRFDNGGYGRIALRGSQRETNYMYAFTGAAVQANGNTTLRASNRDFEQDAFSMDASYSQPFAALGQVSEFVVGTDYKHYNTTYKDGSKVFGTINVNTYDPTDIAKPAKFYTTQVDTDEQELGLYSKVTFRPIARLALIGGARLSSYRGEGYTTTLASGAKTGSDRDVNGHVTPYGGMVFDLDEHHSLYASYSQVFKPQSNVGQNGKLIKPHEGEQFEVGIKGSYFDGGLNARVSAFQLNDKNRAVNPVDANGTSITSYYVAGGKSRIRGAEFEVSGNLTPNWDVLAGYTYMKTESLEGAPNTTFMTMPRHQASLWTKYTLDAGLLSGLSVGGGITGMSDFYMESNNTKVAAPGYATVDAKLSYPVTKQLTATLDVNNLFDREYYSRVGSVSTFNFTGPSRSMTVGARYDF
ncbi:TonB-dependent siderophore receptor [Pseudomonas japonica]|uniref:TonB-dependent siderophore receptor n=1 Tax=Pseudomonas japonica TaxID=256466 RepID=UPI0015E42EDB|nr:TonB-dependent siderophore receptor [Pseudomonas japonica]MBA1243066.1 TonB-dependent siderophore receptor [Pseudomonas japonica]